MLEEAKCLVPSQSDRSGPAAILASAPTGGKPLRSIEVNGIAVQVWHVSSSYSDYVLPKLDFSLSLTGAAAQPVLQTLTYSPRAAVLAGGPPPKVPSAWVPVSVARVSFKVPPSWLDAGKPYTSDEWGWLCERWGTSLPTPSGRLVRDTDRFAGDSAGCAAPPPYTTKPPVTGLIVDLAPSGYWPGGGGSLGQCLHVTGLKACTVAGADALRAVDILFVRITVPGRSAPLLIELGLAGSGLTARTVLYSLARASG
ncbi:MAG: hypothetical protein ACRD0Z_14435 [Acidimicrobiales bacterium]